MIESNFNINLEGRRNHILLLFVLIGLIVIYSFDLFQGIKNFVFLFALMLFGCALLYYFKSLETYASKLILVTLAFAVLITVYHTIGLSHIDTVRLYEYYRWLAFPVFSVLVLRVFSIRSLTQTFYAIAIIVSITMVSIAIAGRQFLGWETQDSAELSSANYSSMIMIMSLTSFVTFLNSSNKKIQFLSLIITLLAIFVNIIVLQRATNLILTVFGIISILVYNGRFKNSAKYITVFTIVLLVMFYATELYIPFFDWMASIVPYRMAYKMEDISMAIQLGDVAYGAGSMHNRSELMTTSWETFTRSFSTIIFGIGDRPLDVTNEIGGHSFLLDTLARYGLLGGFLLYNLFKYQFKVIRSFVDIEKTENVFAQIIIIFVIYVFRNFYGNASTELIAMQIMLFLPISLIINTQKQ